MNEEFFDQRQLMEDFSDCRQLGEVIERLEKKSWKRGRVICEVHVNGRFLSEEEESSFWESSLEEVSNLMVRTSCPKVLLKETINSTMGMLPSVRDVALELANEIHKGEFESLKLENLFEKCVFLTDSLALIKSNWGKFYGQKLRVEDWGQCEQSYTKVVKELLIAFESKDHLLVADLLEYDLSQAFENWSHLIEAEFAR